MADIGSTGQWRHTHALPGAAPAADGAPAAAVGLRLGLRELVERSAAAGGALAGALRLVETLRDSLAGGDGGGGAIGEGCCLASVGVSDAVELVANAVKVRRRRRRRRHHHHHHQHVVRRLISGSPSPPHRLRGILQCVCARASAFQNIAHLTIVVS